MFAGHKLPFVAKFRPRRVQKNGQTNSSRKSPWNMHTVAINPSIRRYRKHICNSLASHMCLQPSLQHFAHRITSYVSFQAFEKFSLNIRLEYEYKSEVICALVFQICAKIEFNIVIFAWWKGKRLLSVWIHKASAIALPFKKQINQGQTFNY